MLSRTLTTLLARAADPHDDLWRDAEAKARLCVLDLVGVALAGTTAAPAGWQSPARAVSGSRGLATVIGGGSTAPADAALRNAFHGHLLDFDDCHKDVPGHAGVTVIPAALATAEAGASSLGELLRAVVWGVEAACLIGRSAGREQYDHGWHPTATFGSPAAAVAAGIVRSPADPDVLADALSLGALQSAGVLDAFGGFGKAWQVGCAARNGVDAAAAAAGGLRGLGRHLTKERGGLAMATGWSDHDNPWDPDARLAIEDTLFKAYASCFGTHAVVEAARELAAGLDAADIESVHVGIGDEFRDVIINPAPDSGLAAKFSASSVTALTLLGAPPSAPDFFDSAPVDRGAYRALEARTSVSVDPDVIAGGGTVELWLRDGSTRRAARDEPAPRSAAAERPTVVEKFHALADPLIGAAHAAELRHLLLDSDLETSVWDLGRLLAAPAGASHPITRTSPAPQPASR